MRQARLAIGRGELVVLPTDTVYGVGADAFSPAAVQRLLDAKGRGRQQPPPVLVGSTATLAALVRHVRRIGDDDVRQAVQLAQGVAEVAEHEGEVLLPRGCLLYTSRCV